MKSETDLRGRIVSKERIGILVTNILPQSVMLRNDDVGKDLREIMLLR